MREKERQRGERELEGGKLAKEIEKIREKVR